MQTQFIPLCRLGLFSLLVLAGCSPETGGDGPEWLHSRPEPVKLDLALDRGRAVTKTITPRGGTLTATGADGTRYRLRIPAGALLSDARITLIPIGAVRGLPLAGGSVAAVQLEPDGLRLMQPATLSIRAEHGVPAAERVAFGYYGEGEDAHRYPLEPDPTKIEMKLLHFSGYGFGRADPDDPGRLALQRATAYEARLQSRIAEAVDRDGQQGGAGLSAETAARLRQIMIEYYDAVIRPLMRTAETDDRLAECCISRYLGWERQVLLLGLDGDERDPAPAPGTSEGQLRRRRTEAQASFQTIFRNAYERGVERAVRQCREEHDFSAIATLLGWERQTQLLGFVTEDGYQRALDEIRKCMNFEVEFRSIFDNRAPANTQFYYDVTARVPVQMEPFPIKQKWEIGSGPLEYVRYDARGNPKDALFGRVRGAFGKTLEVLGSGTISPRGTRPGTFVVRSIDWDWNTVDSPGTDCDGQDVKKKKNRATSFTVTFSPGVPIEITRYTPTHDLLGTGPSDSESPGWAMHWANAHGDEQLSIPGLGDPDDEMDGIYQVALDSIRTLGVWRKEFKRPDPGVNGWSLSEDGYLVLRHTPK